jgi:hypothetical protein
MINENRAHQKYAEFVQQLTHRYDLNGNGQIPLHEFVNVLSDLCQYWGVPPPQGAELQALIEFLGIREDSTYLSRDAIANLAQIIEKSQEGTQSHSLKSKLGLPDDGHGHGSMSNNHSNIHGGFMSNNSNRHLDLGHSPMRKMHESRNNQNHGAYGRNQHNMDDPSNKLFDHDFGNLNHSGMGGDMHNRSGMGMSHGMGGDMHNRSGMGMGHGMGGDMHNRSGMGMGHGMGGDMGHGMGGDMHNRSGMGMGHGMGGDMLSSNHGLNNQNSQMVEEYVRVLFTGHDTDHDGQILKCKLLSLNKNRRVPRHRFGTSPGAESTIPRLYHNSVA